MMIKICSPSDWDFGAPVFTPVKIASTGLRGDDLRSLIKTAGHAFADQVRRLEIKAGEIPVHQIALGATEAWGPNRNGDGFKEATCRRDHGQFVKHARCYRGHKNKDPSKSYGYVKLSAYNEAMRRIELLTMLNGTKEAALRNGGLVADEELEQIHKGKDYPVSMACKVAYDICSSCENKAPNRAHYCLGVEEGGSCKHGGCRHNLGKVAADGHHLHVDNPHPEPWFDISKVGFPADHTAYGGVADYLTKAASGELLGGAALAEAYGLTAPEHLLLDPCDWRSRRAQPQLSLAHKLAAAEPKAGAPIVDPAFGAQDLSQPFDVSPLRPIRNQLKLAGALAALAEQHVLLPLHDFLRLVGGEHEKFADVYAGTLARMPGVYGRLIAEEELLQRAMVNPWLPSESLLPSPLQRKWAAAHRAAYSLHQSAVTARAQRAALHGDTVKRAAAVASTTSAPAGLCEELARHYAMYKLGFLVRLESRDPQALLTMELALRNDYAQ